MYTPQPFREAYLPEQGGHTVYYAQYGNPSGPAIITCHGGPGGKSKPSHVSCFDLNQYHVIIFDQRGCGQSKPEGSVIANTTHDLVADMERIRLELGYDRWFVSGSSWGTTLALVYAEQYPEQVQGLLLSALFLADTRSIQWAFHDLDGVARLFPEGRAILEEHLHALEISPQVENLSAALLAKLQEGSEEERRQVVALVSSWEVNLLAPHIEVQYTRPGEVDEATIASTCVFLHYQAHNFFLVDKHILNQIDSIAHVPVCLVHGRYDILSPLEGAWQLNQIFTHSQLVTLPESAHVIKGDGAQARYFAFAHFLKSC